MLIQACNKRLLAMVAIVLFFAPASHAATALSPTIGGRAGNVSPAHLQLKGPTDNITKESTKVREHRQREAES
ncbi:MAG: hypothetical protein HW419_4044 [Deltaproteobacteria bacterium]|nr:hypothetical protein [Deltaproteobacteria bacterium]